VRYPLIVLFVALQMAIPLHHYVAADNPHDPRFAWRMLLDAAVKGCSLDVRQDGAAVDLGARFSAHWASLARPGRPNIARAMARRLCQDKPGSRVTIDLRCQLFGGGESVLEDGTTSQCQGSP